MGIALQGYASSAKGSFPPNLDSQHISWIGQTVINFSTEYLGQTLNGWSATSEAAKENHDHVMYCPTQEWHRYVQDNTTFAGMELVDYFYLPYRDPASIDYTPAGNGWVEKRKFDSNDARHAPVLTDMIQRSGTSWGPWFIRVTSRQTLLGQRRHFHVSGRARRVAESRRGQQRRSNASVGF